MSKSFILKFYSTHFFLFSLCVIISRDNGITIQIMSYQVYTELILFLFETTRYRMRYLEKYVFEFIPDFSKIPEDILKKKCIYELLDINKEEKEFIERYYKIKYKYFN